MPARSRHEIAIRRLCVGARIDGVWTIRLDVKTRDDAQGRLDRRDREHAILPLCADALLEDAVALRRWLRWRIAALEQPKPTPPLADPFPRSDGAGGAGVPPSPRPAHVTKSGE